MTIKFTIEMLQERRSWEEAHYNLQLNSFPNTATVVNNLAVARANCLGANAQITGIKLSEVPANRQIDFYGNVQRSGTWPNDGEPTFWDSAFGNLALLVKFFGTPIMGGPPSAALKSLYLAGIPNSVIQVGSQAGQDFTLSSAFNTALVAYLNFLGKPGQSTWGYRIRNPVNVLRAIGITQNALIPPQIGVTTGVAILNPVGNVPLVVGDEVYCTGWKRLNPRIPNLEGAYIIGGITNAAAPSTQVTYFLMNTAAVSDTNYNVLGHIGPLAYSYAAYNDWTLAKAVTRKRGASLGAPRGRSRSRR